MVTLHDIMPKVSLRNGAGLNSQEIFLNAGILVGNVTALCGSSPLKGEVGSSFLSLITAVLIDSGGSTYAGAAQIHNTAILDGNATGSSDKQSQQSS
jgi:hypothetical protein